MSTRSGCAGGLPSNLEQTGHLALLLLFAGKRAITGSLSLGHDGRKEGAAATAISIQTTSLPLLKLGTRHVRSEACVNDLHLVVSGSQRPSMCTYGGGASHVGIGIYTHAHARVHVHVFIRERGTVTFFETRFPCCQHTVDDQKAEALLYI